MHKDCPILFILLSCVALSFFVVFLFWLGRLRILFLHIVGSAVACRVRMEAMPHCWHMAPFLHVCFFCVTVSLAHVHWRSMSCCDAVPVCLRSICPVAQMPYLLLQGLLSHDAFCHILFLLRSLHSCPVTGDRHPGSSPVWQFFFIPHFIKP